MITILWSEPIKTKSPEIEYPLAENENPHSPRAAREMGAIGSNLDDL